ncbi:MAG: hypothetical protein AABZ14_06485, partial [Candidatus Margulisiibacteriota bacterium]
MYDNVRYKISSLVEKLPSLPCSGDPESQIKEEFLAKKDRKIYKTILALGNMVIHRNLFKKLTNTPSMIMRLIRNGHENNWRVWSNFSLSTEWQVISLNSILKKLDRLRKVLGDTDIKRLLEKVQNDVISRLTLDLRSKVQEIGNSLLEHVQATFLDKQFLQAGNNSKFTDAKRYTEIIQSFVESYPATESSHLGGFYQALELLKPWVNLHNKIEAMNKKLNTLSEYYFSMINIPSNRAPLNFGRDNMVVPVALANVENDIFPWLAARNFALYLRNTDGLNDIIKGSIQSKFLKETNLAIPGKHWKNINEFVIDALAFALIYNFGTLNDSGNPDVSCKTSKDRLRVIVNSLVKYASYWEEL